LETARKELQLKNVTVLPGFQPPGRNCLVFARAVFSQEKLFDFARHSLCVKDRIVLAVARSVPPLPKGFTPVDSKEYILPLNAGSRKVHIIECST